MATPHEGPRLSGDQALERLIEGNQRFLRGEVRTSAFCLETRIDLARAQRPFATVLGCSDSRVPPEWIFDSGLGELFVIRIAGNVFSPAIAGSLQYAGLYLETPLFVILGHEGCGAISAALESKHEGTQFHPRIQVLLGKILPGLPDLDPTSTPEEKSSRAVESNVRWTVRQVMDTPECKAAIAQRRIKVVGAVYEIESGHVRVLPPDEAR